MPSLPNLTALAGAMFGFAPTRRGRAVSRELAQALVFEQERRLEQRYLADLYPEAAAMTGECSLDIRHDWELPYGERVVLDGIARAKTPRVIFEFGTFTGRTTLLLALAAPEATVHTIDLPPTDASSDPVGSAFAGHPASSRIVGHRADSRTFDFEPLLGSVDLTFVDASHEYDEVVADSQHALAMTAPGGVVIWDDYHPRSRGVYRALNELGGSVPLNQISRTRLVIHRKPAG
jgi:hypothetical protein